MHLDSTLRRGARAEEFHIDGAAAAGIVFALAASLVGCVGSIDAGKGGPGEPPPVNGTGTGGTGGTSTVSGPSACKMDQIGVSPLRRLTRTQYDNSIKDLLGVDLGLSAHFSEDE